MEDLAILVGIIVLTIYSSGFIALGLSFIRNKIWQIVTYVFATLAILSGIWLGISLIDGNGLFIAFTPLTLGVVAIWNTTRRNASQTGKSLPPAPPNQNFS